MRLDVKIYCFIICICLFVRCGNAQNINSSQNNINTEPQILTLILKAKADDNNNVTFEIVNKIISKGTLKRKMGQTSESCYLIYIKNKNKKIVDSAYIDDPLLLQTETITEDSRLRKDVHKMQEAHTDIRVKYYPIMKQIQIKSLHTNFNQSISLD